MGGGYQSSMTFLQHRTLSLCMVVSGEIPSLHQGCGRGKPLPESVESCARVFPFSRDVDRGKPCPVLWKPSGWNFSSF
jgi:hypothetical protein